MTSIRKAVSTLVVSWMCGIPVAHADTWTSSVSITALTQDAECGTNGQGEWINVDLSSSSTTCTVKSRGCYKVVADSNPPYAQIAPLIMAAFLYNKPVQVRVSNTCNAYGNPYITGLLVAQ